MKIEEQDKVLENEKKKMLVSASAGSGKTHVMMQYITKLICDDKIPVNNFLVLTFTKAAAAQMKERLLKNLKEKQKEFKTENKDDLFLVEQIDSLSTANISTIHAFCEKCLKKYASLLDLSENFSVMDEEISTILRDEAFERAYKKFEETNPTEFAYIASAFKNEKSKVGDIIKEIEELANSVADKKEFLNSNLNNAEEYFDKAIAFLMENTKRTIQEFIEQVEQLDVQDFCLEFRRSLLQIQQSENVFDLVKAIDCFAYPKHPLKKVVGDEAIGKLVKIRTKLRKVLSEIKGLNLDNAENFNFQRCGGLEKIVLHLYEIYEDEEQKLKKAKNCLSFSDLEKYMTILSEKENLFDGLEYVFVDEYQDTNKIQEKIVKNVAKNCNFVAVGDAKQGIYGFRLASAEIFLKDLQQFQEGDDSAVNFLKCNFRTNQKVLDFVNNIFKVCMKEDLCGIDYLSTSMLVQAQQERFVDEGVKAVNIDVVAQNEMEEELAPKIYSVKNAQVFRNTKYDFMLKDIKRRIVEVLSSKISEDGQLRKVRFGDIAILSRGRNTLFNQLGEYLQKNGIPVISNSRSALLSQPEIKMLLSYLKLALVFDDDVACMSVLTSGLYCFSVADIAAEKIGQANTLCQVVKESSLFQDFIADLNNFRNAYQIFGLKNALEKLFAKTNYRSFINFNHPNLNVFVDKFLEEVSKFDFDLPSAINYFETVEIPVTSEVSVAEDSVLLTTIHDSKGLEYPIVLLINCDADLFRSMPKAEVEINEKFGLALKVYDQESNKENSSARMIAVKQSEKEKAFVEELMIFYVALTRAKNRLYLFGLDKDFASLSLKNCTCYFDILFYALEKEKKAFVENGSFEAENLSISLIEDVQEEDFGIVQNLQNAEKDEKIVKEIENYLNFSYKFSENQNYRLKESVTSINNKNVEDVFKKFNNESFNFSDSAVEIGNAYHAALKAIEFENVSDENSLEIEIKKNSDLFDENLIDKKILLQNILILKQFTNEAKIYKEKEFIMKEKISSITDSSVEDEILVQGIVDLFVIKNGKATLIDYKFTNSTNPKYLLEKYKNQLKLYKIAIENAFNLKIEGIYLLSLKNHNLIKVDF